MTEECPMCKLKQELTTTQIMLTMAYGREGNKDFDKELEDAALKVRRELIEKNKRIEELEQELKKDERDYNNP